MRKLTLYTSALCLVCVAVTMLALIPSRLTVRHLPLTQAVEPLSPFMVSETSAPANELWVYEAIVGSSYEIFVADGRSGQIQQLTTHFANDRFPVLSPGGKQVAFVSWRDGNCEIYVIDIATGALRNVSYHPALDILPVWSPDGTMLAFNSRRYGDAEIVLADVQRGLVLNLTNNPNHDSQPVWLPDSGGLVFSSNRTGVQERYVMTLEEGSLTHYQPVIEWQTAQNNGSMEVTQAMIPG